MRLGSREATSAEQPKVGLAIVLQAVKRQHSNRLLSLRRGLERCDIRAVGCCPNGISVEAIEFKLCRIS